MSVDAANLAPGDYNAVITINAPAESNTAKPIAVNLHIAPATYTWSEQSGPGAVTFAAPGALVTAASFSAPGDYVLKLTARTGEATASST